MGSQRVGYGINDSSTTTGDVYSEPKLVHPSPFFRQMPLAGPISRYGKAN